MTYRKAIIPPTETQRQYTTVPTTEYPRKAPTGPPFSNASCAEDKVQLAWLRNGVPVVSQDLTADPRNKPVPMTPPVTRTCSVYAKSVLVDATPTY